MLLFSLQVTPNQQKGFSVEQFVIQKILLQVTKLN